MLNLIFFINFYDLMKELNWQGFRFNINVIGSQSIIFKQIDINFIF